MAAAARISLSVERRVRVVGFVDAFGTGLFVPLSVIYLTRIVGLPASQVGVGLGAAGAVAVAAAPIAGALLDRCDARALVVACFGVSAAASIAYLKVDSFGTFLVVAVTVAFAAWMDRPGVAALVVSTSPPADRMNALARQQTMRNLGYGIGGLIAGVALLIHGRAGFDAALLANAASYVLAGGLVYTLPRVRATRSSGSAGGYRQVLGDRAYTRLILLNVAVGLHDSMLRVAMPLWIVMRTSAPAAIDGPLFAVNTLLVAIFQVRVSRSVAVRRSISRAYQVAALAVTAAGAGFALAAGLSAVPASLLLTGALIGLTIAEQHNAAAEGFLSVELAPPALRGRYISLFKSSIALQQAIGPIAVTLLLVHIGRGGWIIIAAIAATAAMASRNAGSGAPAADLPSAPDTPTGMLAPQILPTPE